MSILFGQENTATFSEDGIYRYDLTRWWGEGPKITWVLLNPSTADAMQDDPTIRRCINFSKKWGYGQLAIVNLWALRSTDPKALRNHPDPDGPLNDETIRKHLATTDRTIAAWGAFKRFSVASPLRPVVSYAHHPILRSHPLFCLGITKDGSPKHPLYVKANQEPLPYLLDKDPLK